MDKQPSHLSSYFRSYKSRTATVNWKVFVPYRGKDAKRLFADPLLFFFSDFTSLSMFVLLSKNIRKWYSKKKN